MLYTMTVVITQAVTVPTGGEKLDAESSVGQRPQAAMRTMESLRRRNYEF